MRVTKRNGKYEDIKFDKVTKRISNLSDGLSDTVDCRRRPSGGRKRDGIHSHEIDTLSAEVCVGLITEHPDYEVLATRIVASNCKRSVRTFLAAMRKLRAAGVVTDEVVDVAAQVKDDRPRTRLRFRLLRLKTLEKGYLKRVDGNIIETPQYLFMRVAIGITEPICRAFTKRISPVEWPVRTRRRPSSMPYAETLISSCFLIANKGDSIDESMERSRKPHKSQNGRAESMPHFGCARQGVAHKGTNGTSMVSSRCFACITPLLGTSIKREA